MKVIFVETRGTSKYPHNGLAYLAGNIGVGHDVRIFDLNILDIGEEELISGLQKEKPDLVGFSMKSFNLKSTLALAKKIKFAIGGPFIIGGPHITLCAREFFEKDNNGIFDFGFQGEADVSFSRFCDIFGQQKEYRKIPGLIYKNDEKTIFNDYNPVDDLDSFDFPDFSRFCGGLDFDSRGGYPLLTSRGCPYLCIYCSVSKVSGSKWRFRTPENVLNELKHAVSKYGIRSFQIIDDNFTLDTGRAKKICRMIIEQNLNLRWSCPNGLRADRLDEELVNLMKRSGCESVSLGIESGDEKVFNFINKGEQLDDITGAVKMLKKYGINVCGFFIIGLPLETKKSVKKTLDFISKLGLNGVKWNMLVPYPKTFLWDWVLKNGRFLKNFTDGQHFSKQMVVQPVFETNNYPAHQRVISYKIANLSTGSYFYVFHRPKNKILFYLKYTVFLLRYNPTLFFKKIAKKFGQFNLK
ncbi:MAG: radical SAM protein [Patescibacteria group bacterium]